MEAADILRNATTIAVNGLSATVGKPAHDLPVLLHEHGYTVIGIQPAHSVIDGIPCVATLDDVDADIDILNVFRRSDVTDAIVDEAIARHQRRGDVRCVWLQAGITSQYGREKCTAAGIRYVEDTCIWVVHQVYLRS